MKIFSAAQIQACDAQTIINESIHSIDLMERAATKCADWLRNKFTRESLFVVLCGMGNNGGDGLMITRLLHQRGYGAKAFQLKLSDKMSEDCQVALHRLKSIDAGLYTAVEPENYITDLPGNIIIIDALLGTGLNKPLDGWIATFIQNINKLPNRKIAIDIPSGLMTDSVPDEESIALKAHDTLSFQFYKRSFMHQESAQYTGDIHILDLGLDKAYIENTVTNYSIADESDIKNIYVKRKKYTHKGNYGHALLIGGSYGKTGAITLAAKAALAAGAGLVTAMIPESALLPLQINVPEAMCEIAGHTNILEIGATDKYSAIGIGPGMGTDETSAFALTELIHHSVRPMVLDADALNIIADNKELLHKLPFGSILTPHAKEFKRLFGENTTSMISVDNARLQAARYKLNIVLKGHHTAIVNPEGTCVYNSTGNPGMATAGSGDVLTGILTALLAQGYAPEKAAY